MDFIFNPKYSDPAPEPLGGKAQSLAVLSAQAFPVPDWVVLLPSAFDRSLTAEQRQQLDAGNASALSILYPNPDVQQALDAAVAQLSPNGEPIAVRSSALDEDGSQHSYAGQLDSFLSVPPHKVADRVADVWRSNFSARVLAYRQLHHAQPPTAPAVLIQRMVNADCSGVAFSVDPVTGQRDAAVVAAVRGLGSALVSGETDADTYSVDRQGRIQAAKPRIPNAPVLIEDQIGAIAALVRQVEAFFGRPQDIEWAIENGTLYLLQARPITTLHQVADAEGERNLWDNSNIVESYGGITTPLTFSFARSAYEAVYRQFCRMMGVSEAAIAQHDQTFRHMLGLIRGRIYYNLLSWYRVLALLPGFTVNRRFMEQMMGVREELPIEVLSELKPAKTGAKLRDSWHLLRAIAGLVGNYLTLPRQIKRFYQRLNQALSLPDADLKTMRPDQLAAYYHDLERQLLTRWDAPLINDFFAMIFYGVLRKLCVAWCGDLDGTLQNDLISGSGGMISAEPAQRVEQLAGLAAQQPSFVTLLTSGSLAPILSAMPPAFAAEYQAYLARFGDRCLEELKLESPTLHDDPLPLLRAIGRLAQRGRTGSRVTASAEEPRRTATWRVKQALANPLKRLIFGWVLRNTRRRVRDRENLRFERTRLFGRVRRIFVELGHQFYALGWLAAPRDIFYLEVPEIFGVIDGTATCTNLKGLAALRRAEFEGYQNLPAPSDRFETFGSVHQGNSFQSQTSAPVTGDALQGIGCCPGIVRAPVQVVTDPKHAALRQGSILVAERTDPGWILLFPAATGLLVERGSLLSHSAIVSRELGIPAIVSLPGLTQWLKDGDWVELNGSTGLVQRIEPPAAIAPPLEAVHD